MVNVNDLYFPFFFVSNPFPVLPLLLCVCVFRFAGFVCVFFFYSGACFYFMCEELSEFGGRGVFKACYAVRLLWRAFQHPQPKMIGGLPAEVD